MEEFYRKLNEKFKPISYNRNNFEVNTNLENLKYLVNDVSFIGDIIKLSVTMFSEDIIDMSLVDAIDFMDINIYNEDGTEIVKEYKYRVEFIAETPVDLSHSNSDKILTTNYLFRII